MTWTPLINLLEMLKTDLKKDEQQLYQNVMGACGFTIINGRKFQVQLILESCEDEWLEIGTTEEK